MIALFGVAAVRHHSLLFKMTDAVASNREYVGINTSDASCNGVHLFQALLAAHAPCEGVRVTREGHVNEAPVNFGDPLALVAFPQLLQRTGKRFQGPLLDGSVERLLLGACNPRTPALLSRY